MNLDDSLRDMTATCGPLDQVAERAQAIKFILRQGSNWKNMSIPNKEALEGIATWIGFILSGDQDEDNHWNGIARLARMRGKALEDATVKNVGLSAVRKGLFQVTTEITEGNGPDAA